jgi:hypothetical protein
MAETKNDDVRQVIIEAANVQVAALNAGIVFWSAWVDGASKFAQSISTELLELAKTPGKTDDAIGRFTDLTREYLRKMSELPNTAVARFNAEAGKAAKAKGAPSRAARAKE